MYCEKQRTGLADEIQLKPRKNQQFEVLKTSVQNAFENRSRRVSSQVRTSQQSSHRALGAAGHGDSLAVEIPNPQAYSQFFDQMMADPTNGW